jgi:hypothetical protein
MTIINPNNMPYTPADRPTVTTVSKTTTSITYSITNTNSIQAKIFYEIGDDTPDANNITLAGGASQNVMVSGLTADTNYILYTQAFTATGYSLIGIYNEITESDALYAFTTHTFTSAGFTGRDGPTLVDCRNAYSSISWTQNNSFFNMSVQGIQLWTVPMTGTYRIEVWGSQGGGGGYTGGFGARMRGDFELTKGTQLKILIGQQGGNSYGGGGGGTFVATSNDLPLIVAGGGNTASPWSSTLSHGVTSTSGLASSSGGAGGTNGSGGAGGNNMPGGAGFFGNGGSSSCSGTQVPLSFVNGGRGGITCNSIGGFGGGSGSDGCCQGASGPGGGYSGGGAGNSSSVWGGAGGSINNGINQSNNNGNTGSANRSGNGIAIITKL